MATDPRKRKKKLERKAAKRKEKKHLLIREQNVGLGERLTAATKYPVLDCWISKSMEKEGIGWVVLSRELPDRSVAVAAFLVDIYCLGVKNAMAHVLLRSSYNSNYVQKMQGDLPARTVPPAEARKLLEEAIAYAHGLGFPPHPDCARAMLLFGAINAAESDATFEFGKDGKPFYVSGPNDSLARSKQIMDTLAKTRGPGAFEYLIPVLPPGGGRTLSDFDMDEDEDDFDDEDFGTVRR